MDLSQQSIDELRKRLRRVEGQVRGISSGDAYPRTPITSNDQCSSLARRVQHPHPQPDDPSTSESEPKP